MCLVCGMSKPGPVTSPPGLSFLLCRVDQPRGLPPELTVTVIVTVTNNTEGPVGAGHPLS